MHSLIQLELYHALAADRVRRAQRVVVPERRQHPPPVRGRAAYAAARLASRIDRESARKAVA
jgi:predicted SnoaL-like aldol condensation-catalyzing enzyme